MVFIEQLRDPDCHRSSCALRGAFENVGQSMSKLATGVDIQSIWLRSKSPACGTGGSDAGVEVRLQATLVLLDFTSRKVDLSLEQTGLRTTILRGMVLRICSFAMFSVPSRANEHARLRGNPLSIDLLWRRPRHSLACFSNTACL